jgi:hypothetical protein
MTAPQPTTAEALASALGGSIITVLDSDGPIVLVIRNDRADLIECRPTGSVRLRDEDGGTFELGMRSQGTDVLADKYQVYVAAKVVA